MTRILLYSPALDGHPQVYCRVIGDVLLEQGAELIIATGITDSWVEKWPDLKPFSSRDDVQVIPTSQYSSTNSTHLKAEELCRLQDEFRIDSTLFVEPELFREEFIRIFRRETGKLHGYNAGIFGGTTEWYPGEEFYSGKKINLFHASIRATLGQTKRRLFQPWTIDKYFFEKILIGKRLLDAVIVKDERLAHKYAHVVHWLPEIYKVFDATETGSGHEEYNRLRPEFERFTARFNPDDIVIFFGAGAWYKGYDYFIHLLEKDKSSAGIHAGTGIRHVAGKNFIGDLESKRKSLLEQGRLFETNGYVESQQFVKDVFKSCRRFVSTHRLTVSSGTMLQALEYGLPVLVPDTGLVGHRARTHKLGKAYRYGDSDDLVRQWKVFKSEPVEQYKESIASFIKRFDQSAVEDLFTTTLLRQLQI